MKAPPASMVRKVRVGWRRASRVDRVLFCMNVSSALVCAVAGFDRGDATYLILALIWALQASGVLRDMVNALGRMRDDVAWERAKRRWAVRS